MLGWLWRKLIGYVWCDHKWTVAHKTVYEDEDDYCTTYHLQCSKCGDFKFRSSWK